MFKSFRDGLIFYIWMTLLVLSLGEVASVFSMAHAGSPPEAFHTGRMDLHCNLTPKERLSRLEYINQRIRRSLINIKGTLTLIGEDQVTQDEIENIYRWSDRAEITSELAAVIAGGLVFRLVVIMGQTYELLWLVSLSPTGAHVNLAAKAIFLGAAALSYKNYSDELADREADEQIHEKLETNFGKIISNLDPKSGDFDQIMKSLNIHDAKVEVDADDVMKLTPSDENFLTNKDCSHHNCNLLNPKLIQAAKDLNAWRLHRLNDLNHPRWLPESLNQVRFGIFGYLIEYTDFFTHSNQKSIADVEVPYLRKTLTLEALQLHHLHHVRNVLLKDQKHCD